MTKIKTKEILKGPVEKGDLKTSRKFILDCCR
jgi:hypothetical protein